MQGHQTGQVGGRPQGAPIHLGQAEGGVVGGHDDVGVPAQAHPSPQAEALDGGDHRHLAVVDGGKGGEAAAVDPDQGRVPLGLDLLDVDPGTEPPTFGPQDDHSVVGDPARGQHSVGQGEPAGHVQGVDRRVVNDHLGDPRLLLIGLDGHGCSGQWTTGCATSLGMRSELAWGLFERAWSRRQNCNIAVPLGAGAERRTGTGIVNGSRSARRPAGCPANTKRLVGLGRCHGGRIGHPYARGL